MVGALFVNTFDAKVFDHERKTDIHCIVLPKGRSTRERRITKLCKMHSELVIGNAAGLFETGNALSDLEVYPTVRARKASKVVLVENFRWKDVEGDLHIFETRHVHIVVEVLDVKGKKACIGRGHDTVDQDIGCGQTRTVGGGFPGKSSLSSPTVDQTRWTSDLWGRSDATSRA